MKALSALLFLTVAMPIWYYLLYQILVRVEATELMMFLFWVYLPVGIITTSIAKLSDKK